MFNSERVIEDAAKEGFAYLKWSVFCTLSDEVSSIGEKKLFNMTLSP